MIREVLGGAVSALVILIIMVVSFVVFLLSTLFGRGGRAYSLLLSYDQVGNVILGGLEDEYLSSRCYRLNHIPKYAKYERWINKLFYIIAKEEDHCRKSYEGELQKAKEYVAMEKT